MSAAGARAGAAHRRRRFRSSPSAILRRVPIAGWIAFVACLNAACWSVVTPAFQVSDEDAHVAYIKQLAETGEPPSSKAKLYSQEEQVALTDLHFLQIGGEPGPHTIASQAEQGQLSSDLARAARLPRDGSESAGVATAEPPLYYAIEAIPYLIDYHGTLLGRLELMRLVSALMAGFTALFAWLFVREALPGEPWAWTTAGLSVALAPLLGFTSGAVTPESMLFAVSGALFFCLARAFRRGLTRRLALGSGVVIAVGLLTKLNFVALVPGALVGLAILSWRATRCSRREVLFRLALGLAAPLLVVVAGALIRGTGADAPTTSLLRFARAGPVIARLEYFWQLYLPRLPGMASDFPDISSTRQIWFDGFVGLYGWGDTPFPNWVYDVALIPAAAIACLFSRAIINSSEVLRARAAEFFVYALMSIGVMAMIAAASYAAFPKTNAGFGHARYLFPLLVLLGAVLALAARGAGRRWGPAVGVLIAMLVLAQDIFSQLLVVAHYYG